MRYYFISFTANAKTGNAVFGNALIRNYIPLSLTQMEEAVKEKLNIPNAVILNVDIMTKKQYNELKGGESDGED